MATSKRPGKVDRHTSFACLSVPQHKIGEKHKDEIIKTLKKKGWGVVAEKRRYRFLHIDKHDTSEVSRMLDGLGCDENAWTAYRLSFPTVEAAKAIVDSAEWA
ncbi:MAG TPA: hypothetical protein VE890_05930 [Thermoguttaceae bacterium]|nr:hypothetical protein [Thermoguttaceae bacterium]